MGTNATTVTGLAEQVEPPTPGESSGEPSAPVAEQPESAGRARWWLLAALVLGFAVQVAWRLWLAHSVSTPVAHADEDRYLLSARVLAGGPGGLGNDTVAFRRMGYPLLLAPIYQFTSDPFKVYHAAQAVGSLINALTFPLAYLFGRRVLGIQRRSIALGLAFVAASLPAVAYYSEFALTDVVFPPLGLAWLLLLHGWLTGRTAWSRTAAAVGAGAVIGYTYVLHIRGAILLAIHLCVLGILVLARRPRWRVALASAIAAVLVSQLDWLTTTIVGNRLLHGGVEPKSRLIGRLTDAKGLVHILCDAVGQIWYAGVGTWGLAAVGLVVAVLRIRGRDVVRADWAQRVVLGVAFAATVAIAFSSAAALPEDGRVSNHAYFRYIAFLAPVWVILGAVALIGAGRARAFRLVGLTAAVLGVGTFLVLTQINELYSEWFHPFDTPEVSFLTYTWTTLPVARAAVSAVVLLAVLAYALSAPKPGRLVVAALVAVVAINAAALEVVNYKAIGPMASREYRSAPRLVPDLHIGTSDVVVSSKRVSLGGRLNHQREVYWQTVTEFDHKNADPPADATVVIAPWKSRNKDDWDGTSLGWRRVGADPNGEWAVWLRDSDPRDR